MKTGAVVGIIFGALAVIGGVGFGVYEGKKKCEAEGGVWNGPFKGCSCPSGYALSNGHCCPEGTTWDEAESKCVSTPGPVTSPPGPVDASTINIDWQTPTNADAVNGSLTWKQTAGATSAKVTVNGQQQTVSGPPVAVVATPGDQVSVSIAPCN